MGKAMHIAGVAAVLLAGSAAWANMPPDLRRPPATLPTTQPTTKPAPAPNQKAPGKAKGAILGLGMSALLLGGGFYLVRRRQH